MWGVDEETQGLVLAFDTHRAVKGLRDAGFKEAQAEAVVTIFGEVMDGNLATKSDIADLRTDVKSDITDLRTEMAEFKVGVYRHFWLMGAGMLGVNIATAGFIIAVLKLFP